MANPVIGASEPLCHFVDDNSLFRCMHHQSLQWDWGCWMKMLGWQWLTHWAAGHCVCRKMGSTQIVLLQMYP